MKPMTKTQRNMEKDKRAAPLFKGRYMAERLREQRKLEKLMGECYE